MASRNACCKFSVTPWANRWLCSLSLSSKTSLASPSGHNVSSARKAAMCVKVSRSRRPKASSRSKARYRPWAKVCRSNSKIWLPARNSTQRGASSSVNNRPMHRAQSPPQRRCATRSHNWVGAGVSSSGSSVGWPSLRALSGSVNQVSQSTSQGLL